MRGALVQAVFIAGGSSCTGVWSDATSLAPRVDGGGAPGSSADGGHADGGGGNWSGTESTGASRAFGSAETYGVLDTQWSAPARASLLQALQARQRVVQIP
jgi:hypothetical protein